MATEIGIPVPTDVRAIVTREGGPRTARSDLLAAWVKLHDTKSVPECSLTGIDTAL